jgi:hypothetical protein
MVRRFAMTLTSRVSWSVTVNVAGLTGHYEIRMAGVGSHVRVETMP